MIVLPALYLLSALYCFAIWLNVFQQDTDLSELEKRFSIKLLVFASIFWPIVVPVSFIEVSGYKQQIQITNNEQPTISLGL